MGAEVFFIPRMLYFSRPRTRSSPNGLEVPIESAQAFLLVWLLAEHSQTRSRPNLVNIRYANVRQCL